MVSFEIFVKSMTPSLLESKVTPSFCFTFKIPDDVTAIYICISRWFHYKQTEYTLMNNTCMYFTYLLHLHTYVIEICTVYIIDYSNNTTKNLEGSSP